MAVCLNGHDSASDEVCDVCGTRIPGNLGIGPAGRHASGAVPSARELCPRCGAAYSDPFCERCGLRLRAPGTLDPLTPPPEPARAASPSAGPPESLFPPVPRPEPMSSPWLRAELTPPGSPPGSLPPGAGSPGPSAGWPAPADRPGPPASPDLPGTAAVLESLFARSR